MSDPPPLSSRGTRGYWVSFMDGLQRVILFTTDHGTQKRVLRGNKTQRTNYEVTLSLTAVGISLVNDIRGREVAYIGIPQYVYRSFNLSPLCVNDTMF